MTGHISVTKLETAYEDGSVTKENDGPRVGRTTIQHGWEWALDYSTEHLLYFRSNQQYDYKELLG